MTQLWGSHVCEVFRTQLRQAENCIHVQAESSWHRRRGHLFPHLEGTNAPAYDLAAAVIAAGGFREATDAVSQLDKAGALVLAHIVQEDKSKTRSQKQPAQVFRSMLLK